ncbi:MAG: PEP-utilizing enzyme, partial [Spirulinaceae cyanobacterium]
ANFIEVIRKAGGIITEEESLTSHAAIIGLRLGIPVIVGVKKATEVIREGAILTLDAQQGVIYSGATASNQPNPGMTPIL